MLRIQKRVLCVGEGNTKIYYASSTGALEEVWAILGWRERNKSLDLDLIGTLQIGHLNRVASMEET